MYDYLLHDTAKKYKELAREFCKNDVPKQMIIDMDEDKIQYPREFLEKAAEKGLLGIRFPKEWGGVGADWVTEVAVLEEMGVLPMALQCLYALVSICGEALNKFGNDEQKKKYLKPMLEGKITTAEALTEPRGGSDFFGATTTAKKEGDYYILNGEKRFVVGAEGADFFLVYAKTNPKAPPHESISLFIVDRDMGVDTKYLYGLMGTRGGGAGRIYFRDVKVPKENIILGEGKGGLIFYQMMLPERLTSAAGVLGMARTSIEIASRYAHKRKAFGQLIKNFQAVNFRLADSVTLLDASRGIVYEAAKAIDSGQPGSLCRRLVSEAKKFSTESAVTVVNNAMQVLGGIGYTNVFPVERIARDVRLSTIWTGTSEIMNLIVQHEYFKELLGKQGDYQKDIRNTEEDAKEAHAKDEIVYE
ncbi:MAG: acyl-CoA dehydrogenase family protein [Promethearchaeota archaeon]